MLIIITMSKLLFAMALGFYLNKKGLMDKTVIAKGSTILMNYLLPCLILSSGIAVDYSNKGIVIYLLITGVIIYIGMMLISYLLIFIMRVPKGKHGAYHGIFIFTSCLATGIPVCTGFFGEEAIFYVSILHLPFNLIFFTYGIWQISRDGSKPFKPDIKTLFNPAIICSVIVLIMYFCNITWPEIIYQPIKFVGDLNMPLAMLLIGATIGTYDIIEVLKTKSLYLATLIRLLCLPLLTMGILRLIGADELVTAIATITVGTPVASFVSIAANRYQGNVEITSTAVVMSTVCAMITIPILCLCLGLS